MDTIPLSSLAPGAIIELGSIGLELPLADAYANTHLAEGT